MRKTGAVDLFPCKVRVGGRVRAGIKQLGGRISPCLPPSGLSISSKADEGDPISVIDSSAVEERPTLEAFLLDVARFFKGIKIQVENEKSAVISSVWLNIS